MLEYLEQVRVNLDFTNVTLQQGWQQYQQSHYGIIQSFAKVTGLKERLLSQIVPGPEWTAIAVNATDKQTKIIIRPVSSEASRLVRNHILHRWQVDYGFTPRQAYRLYSSRIPYKHELVTRIAMLVTNERFHDFIRSYPLGGDDAAVSQWMDDRQGALPLFGLSRGRAAAAMQAAAETL